MSSKKLFLLVIFMTFTNVLFAVPPPPPGFPIDGGLGYLVISGLIYGVLKLRNKK
ncbi:MAG: hypothetical protein QM478_11230 [Flavobacteriaceae bacterium]